MSTQGKQGRRGKMGQKGQKGDPGIEGSHEAIHAWRWRLLTIWIVCFTVAVGWSLNEIREQGASQAALEKTNCGLKQFLLTARQARLDSAKALEKAGKDNTADLRAAAGYLALANTFVIVGRCDERPLQQSLADRPSPGERSAAGLAPGGCVRMHSWRTGDDQLVCPTWHTDGAGTRELPRVLATTGANPLGLLPAAAPE